MTFNRLRVLIFVCYLLMLFSPCTSDSVKGWKSTFLPTCHCGWWIPKPSSHSIDHHWFCSPAGEWSKSSSHLHILPASGWIIQQSMFAVHYSGLDQCCVKCRHSVSSSAEVWPLLSSELISKQSREEIAYDSAAKAARRCGKQTMQYIFNIISGIVQRQNILLTLLNQQGRLNPARFSIACVSVNDIKQMAEIHDDFTSFDSFFFFAFFWF